MAGSSKDFLVQDTRESAEGQQRRNVVLPPKFTEFLEGLVDASDRKEGGDVILWLNDLEKDRGYGRFGSSLTGVYSQWYLTIQLDLLFFYYLPAPPGTSYGAVFSDASSTTQLDECRIRPRHVAITFAIYYFHSA